MLESELVSPFAHERSAYDCLDKRVSTHRRSKEKPLSWAANWKVQVVLGSRASELCVMLFCRLEAYRIQSKLILVILASSEALRRGEKGSFIRSLKEMGKSKLGTKKFWFVDFFLCLFSFVLLFWGFVFEILFFGKKVLRCLLFLRGCEMQCSSKGISFVCASSAPVFLDESNNSHWRAHRQEELNGREEKTSKNKAKHKSLSLHILKCSIGDMMHTVSYNQNMRKQCLELKKNKSATCYWQT